MPIHMLPKRFYLSGDQDADQVLLVYKADYMTETEAAVFQSISTLVGLEAFGKHEKYNIAWHEFVEADQTAVPNSRAA